ncbi:hypothetical protein [Methylocystis bryophila]|uniref:Cytochrome c domain-containing protein n=1 Tax=Methylocystis bryophila TaxID=655015 RepID=A0A1W6MZM8_9HYPH|nr:hypothetical protein [Methylocystis bryophila]ARN83040.1 hypothetical protein B1812_20315 [Methylocystis bryophila]BDV39342.1 hypothetical protein DSM21852_25950 [Methylocystis bryophila]
MLKKHCLQLAASLLLALPSATAARAAEYQPFPDGYGYMDPSEISLLVNAVKDGDHAVLRDHGWRMWAGIMQPAKGLDWPVWYTWPNTTAAFAVEPAPGALAAASSGRSLLKRNMINVNIPSTELPYYPIPEAVAKAYPNATSKCGANNICDGAHFQFNGDIMIPTESLSKEAFDWIRGSKPSAPKLYEVESLDKLHKDGVHLLEAPARHIVTKHMYWPVKAAGLSAIPVWRDDYGPNYAKYAGYELWKNLVAVDPSGKSPAQLEAKVSFLYGVFEPDQTTPWPTVTATATLYGIDQFYHHKVTRAAWDSFDEADKAILSAASYWAYNKPFEVGDYLVTVAMHVNTKELPTWALQSVWWSDRADAGPYAANRPSLPDAQGPWAHYLLVDSYGVPVRPGGAQPVAMNPYIELAIHPVATNCNNCHNRAGWPNSQAAHKLPPFASYQNADCPDPLETLNPDSKCLKPLTLTDFQWIIPDRAK